MKSYLKFIIIIFYIGIILFGCTNSNNKKNIVLKIGKLEVTEYEFNRYYNPKGKGGTEDSKLDILQFKQDYIDYCFIIADAYEKQYDTLKPIKTRIKHTSNFMMVQKYGYLWQAIVSPVVDEFKTITDEKIKKREKLYYFEYVAARNYDSLISLTHGDTIIKDLKEYNTLKNKAHLLKFLESDYFSMQWPFSSFWKYEGLLLNLKEGEISPLLYANNRYFYLYLDHIEEKKITDNDKTQLQGELQQLKEYEIEKQTTKQIIEECKPVLNYENIELISTWLSMGNKMSDYLDNIELMKYTLNDTLKTIDVKSLVEFDLNIPRPVEIKSKEHLIFELGQYRDNQYLYLKAEKLGLYQMDSLILGEKNFRNNLVYTEYMNSEIIKNIEVDSSEVKEYYEKNIDDFHFPETFVVDLYVFEKKENAIWSKETVENLIANNLAEKIKDPNVIKGLVEIKKNYEINNAIFQNLPEDFKDNLVQTKTGALAFNSVLIDGKYAILHKVAEKGSVIQNLNEVYMNIKYRLLNKKIEVKRKELLVKLKAKYKIEIDKIVI